MVIEVVDWSILSGKVRILCRYYATVIDFLSAKKLIKLYCVLGILTIIENVVRVFFAVPHLGWSVLKFLPIVVIDVL